VPAGDAGLELLGAAFGDEGAVVQHGDAVGELVGFVEILRGQQDRDPVGGQASDDLPHGLAASRVEPGGGFVEEDDPWSPDQGHGQVEPAAHPARVGGCHLPGRLEQIEPVEQVGGPTTAVGPAQVGQVRHQHQVLPAGEQLVHRRELPGDTDRGAHRVGLPAYVVAGDPDHAGVRRQEGGEYSHGGGLARPVGAQQGENGPLDDVQVDAVEHHLAAEGFANAAGLDGQGGTAGGRRSRQWMLWAPAADRPSVRVERVDVGGRARRLLSRVQIAHSPIVQG
jgi:hypothetical protein